MILLGIVEKISGVPDCDANAREVTFWGVLLFGPKANNLIIIHPELRKSVLSAFDQVVQVGPFAGCQGIGELKTLGPWHHKFQGQRERHLMPAFGKMLATQKGNFLLISLRLGILEKPWLSIDDKDPLSALLKGNRGNGKREGMQDFHGSTM